MFRAYKVTAFRKKNIGNDLTVLYKTPSGEVDCIYEATVK